jgi:hypothetical protein
MTDPRSIPAAAEPAYRQLLALLAAAPPPTRGLSWFTRTVKGQPYWYQQYVVGARRRSVYLGPDDAATRDQVARAKDLKQQEARGAPERKALVATCVAAGAPTPSAALARVVEALAQAGVFRLGGVLLSPIDATTECIEIAVPNRAGQPAAGHADTGRALVPPTLLDGTEPDTEFVVRGRRFTVRLSTPDGGRTRDRPMYLPALHACAKPAPGLEAAIRGAGPAVLLYGAGVLIRTRGSEKEQA